MSPAVWFEIIGPITQSLTSTTVPDFPSFLFLILILIKTTLTLTALLENTAALPLLPPSYLRRVLDLGTRNNDVHRADLNRAPLVLTDHY